MRQNNFRIFKEHRNKSREDSCDVKPRIYPKQIYESLHALVKHFRGITGGASRDRTDDPLLAKQVLSQLSYGP
jgi:hypothetical protein